MPPIYYLYIDGVSITTISGIATFYVESDGLWGEAHGARLWTYSGLGTFLGFSTTSGATLPDTDYSVGKSVTISVSSSIYLYSVATAPNETYLTTGFDLTSIADAIRTKTWGTSDLTFPSQYISSISNLPIGNIQPSRSVTYNSPGSATILPSSGYVGFESASIEFSPNVWDGQYTWTPPIVIIEFTITAPWEKTSVEQQAITFQAEDGMTWSQWLLSEYNTHNLTQLNGYVMLPSRYNLGYTQMGSVVSVSSLVEANHSYSYTLF